MASDKPGSSEVVGVLDGPLTAAGYFRDGLSWSWRGGGSFVALTAVADHGVDVSTYSIAAGWYFESLGDPDSNPATAHDCIRYMTIDRIAGTVGDPVSSLSPGDAISILEFERRLATVFRKHVLGWLEPWKRAGGFRDFLADQKFHLAAGWVSAVLGHEERARLELAYAAHVYNQPLDAEFDRLRAEQDEAFTAVFAARNGLKAYLAGAEASAVSAFDSRRGDVAQDKVVNPAAEHRRMQLRHQVFAATCVDFLESKHARDEPVS